MSDRQSRRYFDSSRNLTFVWDRASDKFVYENDTWRPRRSNEDPSQLDRRVPRTSGNSPTATQTSSAVQGSRARGYGIPGTVVSSTGELVEPAYGAYAPEPSVGRGQPLAQSGFPPSVEQVASQLDKLTVNSAPGQQPRGSRRDQRRDSIQYSNAYQDAPASSFQNTAVAPGTASWPSGQSQRSASEAVSPAQLRAQEDARRQQFMPRAYATGDGLNLLETYNPRTGIKTTIASGRDNDIARITDPALLQRGVESRGMLMGNPTVQVGEPERLYSSFRVRPHDFFIPGRVFLMLWVEPAGTTAVTSLERNDFIPGKFQDEFIYSKVRRFVVIRQGLSYCSALPIMSYGSRGTSKKGVNKSEHVIIHTGAEAPAPMESEAPVRGESGMRPIPIRVTPDDPTEKLGRESRLDLGKVNTVQHNIKVKPFGLVHPNSMDALVTQFQNVWNSSETQTATLTSMPSSSGAYEATKRSRRVSVSQGQFRGTVERSSRDETAETAGRAPSQPGAASAAYRQQGQRNVPSASAESTINISSRSRTAPVQAGGPAAQRTASDSTSTAATARAAYQQLRNRGASHDQAMQSMTESLMRSNPGLSRDAAASEVWSRLDNR